MFFKFSIGIFLILLHISLYGQMGHSYKCEKFEILNGRLIINSEVDGDQVKLFVSTAEPSKIFINATKLAQSSDTKKYDLRNNLGIKRDRFSFEQPPDEIPLCKDLYGNVAGILGLNFLSTLPSVLLDFNTSELCVLTESDLKYKIEDFREVKSKFYNGQVEIVFSINWKEHRFIFDTGYQYALLMPFRSNLLFLRDPHQIWIGDEFSKKRISKFVNKGIWMDGTGYNTTVVVDDYTEHARVGINFIKGFNWIIDYQNRKLYYQKSATSLGVGNGLPFLVTVNGNELQIAARNLEVNQYRVGQYIKSINGQLITVDNMCLIFQRLRSNEITKEAAVITTSR